MPRAIHVVHLSNLEEYAKETGVDPRNLSVRVRAGAGEETLDTCFIPDDQIAPPEVPTLNTILERVSEQLPNIPHHEILVVVAGLQDRERRTVVVGTNKILDIMGSPLVHVWYFSEHHVLH